MTLSGPPPSTPHPIGPGGPKERSGWLVALYVVLGLGALLIVLTGIATWLFVRSEEGQRVLATAREGFALAEAAGRAPGTEQLREAGCETAMVTSFGQMFDLVAELLPAEQRDEVEQSPLPEETLVLCILGVFADAAPGCGEVASVYGAAVPDPPERFVVIVQKQGLGEGQCQGFFAPDGRFLGGLYDDALPES